jgi:hypothetical protein
MSNIKSLFLACDPSLLSGVARLMDFSGTFDSYNRSANEELADARAIFWDWRMVGEDLLVAARNAQTSERLAHR